MSLPWTQPQWLEEAQDWIRTQADRLGLRLQTPIRQEHVRPWSTVLSTESQQGKLFFKASAPYLAHEAALTQALAAWRPDCMLPVLAADVERGWLLLPDAGTPLRAQLHTPADLRRWEDILPLFAQVQMELAAHTDDLLRLGIFDRQPSRLAADTAALLEDTGALVTGGEDSLTPEQAARLRQRLPALGALCAELAASGLPNTLHHDDFHDANIFMHSQGCWFTDWGESALAHPFFSLLVTLRSVENRLGLLPSAPECVRMRDAYLEAWSGFAPRSALLEIFALSQRAAMPARALTWHWVIRHLPADLVSEYQDAVPGYLGEFLALEEARSA